MYIIVTVQFLESEQHLFGKVKDQRLAQILIGQSNALTDKFEGEECWCLIHTLDKATLGNEGTVAKASLDLHKVLQFTSLAGVDDYIQLSERILIRILHEFIPCFL